MAQNQFNQNIQGVQDTQVAWEILHALLCHSTFASDLDSYRDDVQEDLKLSDEQMDRVYNLERLCALLKPPTQIRLMYKGREIVPKRQILADEQFQRVEDDPDFACPTPENASEETLKPASEQDQEPVQASEVDPERENVSEETPDPDQTPDHWDDEKVERKGESHSHKDYVRMVRKMLRAQNLPMEHINITDTSHFVVVSACDNPNEQAQDTFVSTLRKMGALSVSSDHLKWSLSKEKLGKALNRVETVTATVRQHNKNRKYQKVTN